MNVSYRQQRQLVKMKYCDTISINVSSASGLLYHTFAVNDVNDPDVTSTGHQPLGYDIMAEKYSFYKVLGSRIRVTHVTTAADGGVPGIFGVTVADMVGSNYQDYKNAIEQSRNNTWRVAGDLGYTRNQYIVRKWSLKKATGYHLAGKQDDSWGAYTTTGPTEKQYYHIWASPILSNDPNTMVFLVEIEYIVLFGSPKQNNTD